MPCSIVDDGIQLKAPVGSTPTVRVIAENQKLTFARYNGAPIPVTGDDTTTFTVVAGPRVLLLALAGPKESVEIVEDCGNGETHHLFGFENDFQPVVTLTIVGF